MRFGGWQLLAILVLVVLLFGARRLPDLARSVGQSLKIFKSEVKDLREEDEPREPGTATGDAADARIPGGATGPGTGTGTATGTGTFGGQDDAAAGPSRGAVEGAPGLPVESTVDPRARGAEDDGGPRT